MADKEATSPKGIKKKPNRLSKRSNNKKKPVNSEEEHEEEPENTNKLSDRLKGKRNPNWSLRETRALISHVISNYDVLFGNHAGSDRTESEKDKLWKVVVVAVNS